MHPDVAVVTAAQLRLLGPEAARYAAERFPEHADLARRCLAHRQGTPQRFSVADARAGVDLGRAAIADAGRCWRRVRSSAQ